MLAICPSLDVILGNQESKLRAQMLIPMVPTVDVNHLFGSPIGLDFLTPI